MPEQGDGDPIRRYVASLSQGERQEFARALLAESSTTGPGRQVGSRLLWASRLLFVAVLGVYWSWHGFAAISLPRLLLGLWLPGAVAIFPNELSRAVGRLGATTRIDRPSAPRIALALAWFILALPLLASVARGLLRAA